MGTGEDGLFERVNGRFRRYETEADTLLTNTWLYTGTTLPDGTIALATIGDGLLFLGPEGTLLRQDAARGKPVLGLHVGPQDGLWAMLDGGLLRYATDAPLTRFGRDEGLSGPLSALSRHRGVLHVGTNGGVYRMRTRPGASARFEPLDGSLGRMQTWDLLSTADGLLISTLKGVWVGREGRSPRRIDGIEEHVYGLHRALRDSARVYAVGDKGLYVLVNREGFWKLQSHPEATRLVMRNLHQPHPDTLWAGRTYGGTVRIHLGSDGHVTAVDTFGTEHGLPVGSVTPQPLNGRTVFSTNEGLYRFEPAAGAADTARFVPTKPLPTDAALVGRPADVSREVHLRRDGRGGLWGRVAGVPGRWTSTDADTLSWRSRALRPLYTENIDPMLVERDGRMLWAGGRDGLVQYRRPDGTLPDASYGAYVDRVKALQADTLLALSAPPPEGTPPILPYAENSVRIRYAAPSYHTADPLQFQVRLRGYSDTWSDWTTQTAKEYTSLGPGLYTFEVRALNAYGEQSTVGRTAFRVAVPWYRRWWAYGGYLLILGGFIFGVVRWRTRHLRRRQEELEDTIAERTQEVRDQRDQLEQQAEQLKELDEAKSRYFANVSHEFRTPLTLLLGPLKQLRDAADERLTEKERDLVDRMERNVQRLRRLIDQVLDLAELDTGALSMNARPLALAEEVERLARAFEPMAERQQIALVVEADTHADTEPPVIADPEQLEHVVGNLLSNALKFTPEGGQVTVRAWTESEAGVIEVADTGPGIPPDQQEAVFDRFEQGADTRSAEGSGIGLAYVKELVDLHGGTIAVESTEGDGTTFTVRLPRGRDALPEEHLADAPTDEEESTADRPPVPPSMGGGSGFGEEETTDSDAADRDRTTVLIVDDNADVREYVRSILSPDFQVCTAADGKAGLAAAQAQLPDCILADVMMPNMDGVEMVEALREDPATNCIPVIMLTARAATEDELEGLGAGADDYVTKPFEPAVLQARVRGHIDLRRRLRRRVRRELQAGDGDGHAQGDPEPSGDSSAGRPPQLVVPTPSDEETEFVTSVREAVEERLADPDLSVEGLAEAVHVSRSTLYRRLKEEADASPTAFIRRVRVQHGARLLREEEGTISEVAYAVGFNSLTYFSRSFREHFGLPPSDYVDQGA